MSEAYISLISGFLGAIIGAAATILTMFIQSRSQERRERLRQRIQDRRERLRQAADLAIQEWKTKAEKIGGRVPPIMIYWYFYIELMQAFDRGPVTTDIVREIATRCRNLQMDEFRFDPF